jgi:hypothetical protein
MSTTEFDQTKYNKAYYNSHKQDILLRKRERYKKDKGYRDRVKSFSRERYVGYKEDNGAEVYSFGESQEDSSIVKGHDGKIYYSAKHAAVQANVCQSTIRKWSNEGVIPPPKQEERGRGWRWFNANQLAILNKFRGYNTMPMKTRTALRLFAKQHWNCKEQVEAPE